MSDFPTSREPQASAEEIQQERKIEVLINLNRKMMELIVQAIPSLAAPIGQLEKELWQANANIDAEYACNLLTGKGRRGLIEAEKIVTSADYQEFTSKLVEPYGTDVDVSLVLQKLEQVLAVNGAQGRRWAQGNQLDAYAAITHDHSDNIGLDMATAPDGLYRFMKPGTKTNEYTPDKDTFILRVGMGRGKVFMFSPEEGPSILTYSPMEDMWVYHHNINYVNVLVVLENLREMFEPLKIGSSNDALYQQIYVQLTQMDVTTLEAKGVTVTTDTPVPGFQLPFLNTFCMHVWEGGAGAITSPKGVVDMSKITDLSIHYMLKDIVAHLTTEDAVSAEPEA